MLSVDVVTIFPRMVEAPLADSIVARAVERGIVVIGIHDLRDYADDKHRSVDDAPFGGGPGMVMKAEPFFRAVEALPARGSSEKTAVVLLSPRATGRPDSAALFGLLAPIRPVQRRLSSGLLVYEIGRHAFGRRLSLLNTRTMAAAVLERFKNAPQFKVEVSERGD